MIRRMATRLTRPEGLAGGVGELLRDYAGFEADFDDFIGDAIRMVAGEGRPA